MSDIQHENRFERDRYLRVVSMNAASARAFAMPDAFLVVYGGQADPARYRFCLLYTSDAADE